VVCVREIAAHGAWRMERSQATRSEVLPGGRRHKPPPPRDSHTRDAHGKGQQACSRRVHRSLVCHRGACLPATDETARRLLPLTVYPGNDRLPAPTALIAARQQAVGCSRRSSGAPGSLPSSLSPHGHGPTRSTTAVPSAIQHGQLASAGTHRTVSVST